MEVVDIHPDALALLRQFEGLHDGNKATPLLEPQKDPIGIPTLGYGAIYGLDGKRVTMDHPAITHEQAGQLLVRDLLRFKRGVRKYTKVQLPAESMGALVSFAYNLGVGSYRASTLRRRVNARRFDDAPYQFSRWNKAGGRVLRGLTRRRKAEAKLFMRGLKNG